MHFSKITIRFAFHSASHYSSRNFTSGHFILDYPFFMHSILAHLSFPSSFCQWQECPMCTVGWGTKAQCFRPPNIKTWFFYVVFNAELYGTIRILCFHRSIIDLLWPSCTLLGHSRSIMLQRKHEILMVPFNSALKPT